MIMQTMTFTLALSLLSFLGFGQYELLNSHLNNSVNFVTIAQAENLETMEFNSMEEDTGHLKQEDQIREKAEEETEEESDGSWKQINQSLSIDDSWIRIVEDPSSFSLGDSVPYSDDNSYLIRDWGTYPSMDGSTVCVPMAMEFARQWLPLSENDLTGFVNFSTTPVAVERLISQKPNPMVAIQSEKAMMDDQHPIDLYLGTMPNTEELESAEQKGVNLVAVPVCCDAFVFIVNGKNPVNSLTEEQIHGIYYTYYDKMVEDWVDPKIQYWHEILGEDEPEERWWTYSSWGDMIIPYGRPKGSGSQTAMDEMVMHNVHYSAPESYVSGGMGDLIHRIGDYPNSDLAIGYSYLYYIDSLYKSGDIKVLAVNGIEPTDENIRNHSYPYSVYYYAIYREGDKVAEKFADWIVSDEGQRCIAQAGYVPLREIMK